MSELASILALVLFLSVVVGYPLFAWIYSLIHDPPPCGCRGRMETDSWDGTPAGMEERFVVTHPCDKHAAI